MIFFSHLLKLTKGFFPSRLPGCRSWVRGQGSRVGTSRVVCPGSRILDRRSRVEGPGSRSWIEVPSRGPGSRVQGRGSRFEGPGLGSRFGGPGLGSRVEGPGSRSRFGVPGRRSRVESPGSRSRFVTHLVTLNPT